MVSLSYYKIILDYWHLISVRTCSHDHSSCKAAVKYQMLTTVLFLGSQYLCAGTVSFTSADNWLCYFLNAHTLGNFMVSFQNKYILCRSFQVQAFRLAEVDYLFRKQLRISPLYEFISQRYSLYDGTSR